MQNALAAAWLAIDDATKTPKHRPQVQRLARFMKNRLRPMADGSYTWAYWPPLEGAAGKLGGHLPRGMERRLHGALL